MIVVLVVVKIHSIFEWQMQRKGGRKEGGEIKLTVGGRDTVRVAMPMIKLVRQLIQILVVTNWLV
jgi:hypothetical protein